MHLAGQLRNSRLVRLLSEHRVELFGDVVIFIIDFVFSKQQHDVWIGLAIEVCRMKVIALKVEKTVI